jgi:integrase
MWNATKMSAKGAYDAGGRRKYLSRDEGRKFLHHAALLPKPEALFCQTIYYTGCRISEALNWHDTDVDLEMNVILIRSLKKRGKREIRRIPAPEFLIAELKNLTASGEEKRLWHFSRSTGWRVVKSVMNAAQISGVHATAKGLRHGFGVRAVLMQIPVTLIQNWMGHSDLSTTAIYLAVKDEEEREFIEKTW